ncbi:GIY-YIG nuclease family protein [Jannaschia seohaensis]|uniref:GIY-YIG catalytic domain-containing protein n=1 Tax=Jannaschia seohaensis TaxID=475081 RepID=A0A2Y9AUE9_9RHOB|nr:hypothetical protein [Jannaschia seohaensis]PWJ19217.1 hypothetical protein BCF38_104149 [Jannaschia seohaensis]SSA45879.1 hypothetical protein SAMN05421539_104149 [Jannaschia seohaensis]
MDIAEALLIGRRPITDVVSSQKAGLYGIFAKRRDCLPGMTIPDTEIIYIGQTGESLGNRNHFLPKSSGFHSPRRSLGAILKVELNLQAVPRAPGPSESNFTNFAFAGDGEHRLSNWMVRNLDYATVELEVDLHRVEKETIRVMQPPLNLTGWANPQKRHIMDLRNACKAEAKTTR